MSDVSSDYLDDLIAMTASKCLSWVGRDERGNTVLIDPHEGRVIGYHYALSHFAAAMILGWDPGSEPFELSVEVLRAVLDRWDEDARNPAFHWDFNNFALCLCWEELERKGVEPGLRGRIKSIVLSAPDSGHDTVNWLPMRMYVNAMRSRWLGQGESREFVRCRKVIGRALDGDGFIEDRLPKGVSFNLQYDVSTVAILDLLDHVGIAQPIGLDKAYRALAEALCPDGDINYLGRGCNQVFAWGPWIYLLASRGDAGLMRLCAGYLRDRLPSMLENDNLLLNALPGSRRQLWWDYHYCSVYTAHLLLWLVLARRRLEDGATSAGDGLVPSVSFGMDSGVRILRSDKAFVATFSGRREYLAESGPTLSALWTARRGAIHKGSFGPWQKAFGLNWSSPSVQLNHFGLLGVARGRAAVKPRFVPIAAELGEDEALLTYRCSRECLSALNLPMLDASFAEDVSADADGKPVRLRRVGSIVTQYGLEALFQSAPCKARVWTIRVRL